MSPETLWEATGVAIPATLRLETDIKVDVAVIGAGYCGLNAALELAARGVDVAVLEALPLGKGASGRSGGFVAGRFRMPPATVLRKHGQSMVDLMQRVSAASVEQVQRNVQELDIPEAALAKHGSIRAAINATHFRRMEKKLASTLVAEFGNEEGLRLLGPGEMTGMTGSRRFAGGVLDPGVQGLHPFNYTMGLARAAMKLGAPLYCETPVLRLRDAGDHIELKTPAGRVAAKQVIMATDAYSRLTEATRELAVGVVPFRSCAIATAPLPAELRSVILPGGQMMFDSKRVLRWFRMIEGRLVIGGRGAGSEAKDEAAYQAMHRNLMAVFPQLADIPIEHRWSGYVGITMDGLPHVGRVSDRLIIAGGFNGNGVAMASLFGRYAARTALDERLDTGILHASWLRRIPFYHFAAPGVRLAAHWMQTLDQLGV